MTDRINALTVVLEIDLRDDDVQPLIDAIRQLRGVLAVERNVADVGDFTAQVRARAELEKQLWAVLKGTP